MDTNRVTQRDPDDTLDAHYSALERLYRPHGCYEGFVYIGHIAEDENGEPQEVIERCLAAGARPPRKPSSPGRGGIDHDQGEAAT